MVSMPIALGLWSYPVDGHAEESPKSNPVRISAETLVADDAEKFAEFSGNVRATQGETVINADRLKIFYDSQGSKEGGPLSGSDVIKKVVATGNVNIRFKELTAESQNAVYTVGDRVLLLSGPNSKVTREKSGTIAGSQITIHRDTGKIRFEGGVEGTFFTGDSGLE